MTVSRIVLALRHWAVALVVVGVALLLASALVMRLSATLSSPVAGPAPAQADVRLETSRTTDNPVFDESHVFEPGQSIQSCLAVSADTDGVNRGVTLQLDRGADRPASALADRVQITIERGRGTFATGDDDGSCRGFVAEQLVASDTLAGVLATDTMPVWRPPSGDATTHFRFTARLSGATENVLQAQRVDDVALTFVATADDSAPVWVDSASVLLNSLARRSSLPVVVLVGVALFFSAVQAIVAGGRRADHVTLPETRSFEPPSLA